MNFIDQINEDLIEIKNNYLYKDRQLEKDEYAFNFWILQKMYSLDEEIILDQIVEYNDKGIDCFYFNEDRKQLYLIQNKFYNESNHISFSQIIDQFLNRTLTHLDNETYARSKELKEIFNKYKEDPELEIFLDFYITNDSNNYRDIKEKFNSFKNINVINGSVVANFYSLSDIKQKYYGHRTKAHKVLDVVLHTLSKFTRIDINSDIVKDLELIQAQAMPINVYSIYKMVCQAKDNDYSLFEENIRDFIGEKTQINSDIINTLEDENERKNFLYYNNGITIIADEINVQKRVDDRDNKTPRNTNKTSVKNPQIINGCQTVNSIYFALSKIQDEKDRLNLFKNTYVMTRILKLSILNDKDTYFKIVRYNNSQNSIKMKDFITSEEIFHNLKNDFESLGFFICHRQSDDNDFRMMKKSKKEEMFSKAKKIFDLLNIPFKENYIKIKLDKLLQILLAYHEDGYIAYTKKSEIFNKSSSIYEKIISYLKNTTNNKKISLYLIYLKAEIERKETNDNQLPNPFYLLTIFKKMNYEISLNSNSFLKDYKNASNATKIYVKNMMENYQSQYNKMIKQKMKSEIIDLAISTARSLDT